MYYAKVCNLAFFKQNTFSPQLKYKEIRGCGMVNAMIGTVKGVEMLRFLCGPHLKGDSLVYTLLFIFTTACILAIEELLP